MRGGRYVTRTGEKINLYAILVYKWKDRRWLEKTALRRSLWIGFIWLQLRDSVNSIINIWVSQSWGFFFNLQENYKFLRKVYAPRSQLRIYKERKVGSKEAFL
jgi:hypothetical protein